MPNLFRLPTRGQAVLREVLIFSAFAALTCAMTWPWVLNMREAAADNADSYMFSWILWWDYHQTFHDPLNLFQANIFYPYRYTLAFCEHIYGIAFPLFPLFALGLRPLTVAGIATLLGFALCGYGAFRLARTLTGSNGAAWVAGVAFAFIPLRFNLLAHLDYLNAGWIALLLEALVLYARRATWKRAVWLGVAFLMNALSCVTWFILTLIPLALSLWVLVVRHDVWRQRTFWLRGAVSVGAASLLLLPFLLPYYWVSQLYGFRRSASDVAVYSARVTDWLVMDERNKLWRGFGSQFRHAVLPLFPGLLLPLLALVGTFLAKRPEGGSAAKAENDIRTPAREPAPSRRRRGLLLLLDACALLCLAAGLLATMYGTFRTFGIALANFSNEAFFLLVIVLLVRFSLAYPRALPAIGIRSGTLIETFRSGTRGEIFQLGIIWLVVGFAGSLGLNFFFHSFLYEHVPFFQAVRSPARWAMVACLGLALLGGFGAERLATFLTLKIPRACVAGTVYLLVVAALLFEFRVAPLYFIRGAVDPDAVTLHLKDTPMKGGIVELPAGEFVSNYLYLLRAADHARPLVTAVSGFITPTEQEIEALSRARPVPERFLDLLEEIPASYLVVHNSTLNPESRLAIEAFLERGRAANRLRFIQSFGERDDLYAVLKTEPEARTLASPPPPTTARDLVPFYSKAEVCLPPEYRADGFFLHRLYKTSFGRHPRRAEFLESLQAVNQLTTVPDGAEQDKKRSEFVMAWVNREEFRTRYEKMRPAEFVDALYANAGLTPNGSERAALIRDYESGALSRAQVLRKIVDDDTLYLKEFSRAFVLMHFFYYLRRNPDDPPDTGPGGLEYWGAYLDSTSDFCSMEGLFRGSREHKSLPGN
jgi:hypothetical protein